jgi:DNA-binding MarR family transcriptional regulator
MVEFTCRGGLGVGDQSQIQETGDPGIVLSVLTSIERDSAITQRRLARDLGIALGLANAYLRRCVRKGLVKVRQVPINRYAYYLTPQGFAEKSRLTAEYLTLSLNFFRRARDDCAALFRQCEAQGWRTAVLYGAGDLAEIAVLSAAETVVEVLCIVDPTQAGGHCGGRPIVPNLVAAGLQAGPRGLDGIVVTDMQSPQASFDDLLSAAEVHGLAPDRIVAPRLLHISPSSARLGEETAP